MWSPPSSRIRRMRMRKFVPTLVESTATSLPRSGRYSRRSVSDRFIASSISSGFSASWPNTLESVGRDGTRSMNPHTALSAGSFVSRLLRADMFFMSIMGIAMKSRIIGPRGNGFRPLTGAVIVFSIGDMSTAASRSLRSFRSENPDSSGFSESDLPLSLRTFAAVRSVTNVPASLDQFENDDSRSFLYRALGEREVVLSVQGALATARSARLGIRLLRCRVRA